MGNIARKRLYHVGLNRGFNPLKRSYYRRRGWLKGMYYVRPVSAAGEWAHSLASPGYAEGSWLRISPQAEERALSVLKTAVIVLFAAAAFMWGVAYGEHRAINRINHNQQQLQIQLRAGGA